MSIRNPIVIAVLGTMILSGAGRQSGTQAEADPERALWSALKRALTNADADEYFETHLKNSELPPLKGAVTTAVLNQGVSKIVLAMSDADTAEVTLIVHEGDVKVKTKPNKGAEIEFSGEAVEFTKTPFMLTFDVPIKNVKGLDVDQTR
jgi:hypothetical protein